MNEWIKSIVEIVAAGATLWAALSARESAKNSSKQLNTQIEQQDRVERPRLVPLNHKVSTDILSIFSDWETEENDSHVRFRFKNKMSRYFVPVINTGKSFAFDVRYSFHLRGGIDAFSDYKNDNIELKLTNPELRQIGASRFNFSAFEHSFKDADEFTRQDIEVIPYRQYISLVQSNELSKLNLPKFFIILSNVFMKEYWSQTPNIKRPEVMLVIRYKDQFHTEHVEEYLMSLSTKQLRTDTIHYSTWIDFQFVSSSENKTTFDKKSLPAKVSH